MGGGGYFTKFTSVVIYTFFKLNIPDAGSDEAWEEKDGYMASTMSMLALIGSMQFVFLCESL